MKIRKMNCLWTDCRGSSSGAPSQDNRSITQQLHLLGWAGLGWLGWQGFGPHGDSETVRCQMLAVADTGHWTEGRNMTKTR